MPDLGSIHISILYLKWNEQNLLWGPFNLVPTELLNTSILIVCDK